jgi:hypothetical protein
MLRHLTMRVTDQARRQGLCQLTPPGLVQETSCQATAERVQLDLGDRPLQSQEEPPIRRSRVVHAVPIANEALPVAAEIQQRVPV